jgi:hypothetical protein
MEAPGEGPALDKEVDLEARQQYVVERSDDELILTDGQNPHVSDLGNDYTDRTDP